MWTEGKYEDWWNDDNPDPRSETVLTRDPNKVGYSGLECPDVEVEEVKRICFSMEQYVESAIVVDLPEGYEFDDVDFGDLHYENGETFAMLTMKDGKEFELGTLEEPAADDYPRVRITDEDWTEDLYDSWS